MKGNHDMPVRTGKQTGLLVLGIMKLLGGIGYLLIGLLCLVYGEIVLSALNLTGTSLDTILFIVIGASVAYGLGGVVHGVLDILGSRPGQSATAAGIFGICACLGNLINLFEQISSVGTRSLDAALPNLLGAIVMLVLNVARAFLAFSISTETKANMLTTSGMGWYPQYGAPDPFSSMPQLGGYRQPPQPQQGGYAQTGMTPPSGYNGQNDGYGRY